MSSPHFGFDKPDQESLTQPLGVQPLPLALLPTSQQGSPTMTRLATVSQGGRISARSTASNGVNDTTIASLLSSQSNSLPNVGTVNSPRKRKLPPEEYVVLRRKVTECKTVHLHRLQTSYAEHCALLCFLEEDGQPADYSAWRSRLPPVPLTDFLQANKLNPADENEDLFAVLLTSEHSSLNTSLPFGRNSQGVPAVETSKHLVHSNNVDKRLSPTKLIKCSPTSRTSTPVKLNPPQQFQTPSSSGENCTSQEQIVEKAKQEAYVMQRIGELQRDGLWAEKRLPKVHELPRAKAHWDYLIEEMVWLAADFAQERKWKKAAAKKCARMVHKYFQEKESLAQKAVKAKEMQLKRIASCMAKEIKQFWTNVEKLVEFKQQTRLEEKRKKALDQHLSFIVDQTEKYSSLVAESMNTSHPSSPKLSDVEFEPDGSSDDDEETIAKEEALAEKDEAAISAEVDALKRESEIPLEELLSDYLSNRDALSDSLASVNQMEEDEDYRGSDKNSTDDEETIQEQEVAEGEVDYRKEIDELKAEGDLSIEELRAKYGQLGKEENKPSDIGEIVSDNRIKENEGSKEEKHEGVWCNDNVDEDDDDDDDDDDDEGDGEEEEEEEDEKEENDEEEDEVDNDMHENDESDKEDATLKTLLSDASESSTVPGDKEINDVAAIAQSLQPKGNTLSSTSVVTKVPFLLKHPLREYQHIGLDWLVTMHDRKLNGILADEMGLGKTIQTIALLAHLACEKGNWGPHLIVVPTSVMLNWEMEFKKWCPAFKILTYFGTQKERKMKRAGWTKPNAFHVCITSYKLVIQDHQSFRRKKWKYLILDEAQNIKNFKSQRWQLLLNFQTQRRLLLTGTPLQNNLMELWSLMHFLMPNVFESHKEFKEWFSNPVTGMIEGNSEYNDTIIKRLHKVLRPFLLRRLKSEVETQMPKKYEHIVMCRLSNRQRYLYDDFMSRAKTKETLATGSLLSVINVLMQLRKVCNHPNLFEVRPTVSPFQMECLSYTTASLVYGALDYNPFTNIDLSCLNLLLVEVELWLLAFVAHRAKKYKTPSQLIQEIDSSAPDPPPCPKGKIKIHVRRSLVPTAQVVSPVRPAFVQVGNNHRLIASLPAPRVGTSPIIKTLINQGAPNQGVTLRLANPSGQVSNYLQLLQQPGGVKAIPVASLAPGNTGQVVKTGEGTTGHVTRLVSQLAQLVTGGRPILVSSQQGTVMTAGGQRLTVLSKQGGGVARLVTPAVTQLNAARPIVRFGLNTAGTAAQNIKAISNSTSTEPSNTSSSTNASTVNSNPSPTKQIVTRQSALNANKPQSEPDNKTLDLKDEKLEILRRNRRKEKLKRLAEVNDTRCQTLPIYGVDLVSSLRIPDVANKEDWRWSGGVHCRNGVRDEPRLFWSRTESLSSAIHSVEDRVQELSDIFSRFVLCVPAVSAPYPKLHVSHPAPWKLNQEQQRNAMIQEYLKPKFRLLHPIVSAMATQFPDPRLIQYDCGKLQSLDRLLRRLKSEHHRALIFTQMTRMLDVLEAFLNFHGHIYLRLDGTTKVDQRQVLMDRFNIDRRIFCFILSTRSGGVGVNLTGADTVIFYDSDWNPTMDAQAQDRCHRIGQTRDVHIYRLVSEKTVEENILKKANQKRMLGDIAIEGGNFTTAYFKSSTIQDLFNVDVLENDASNRMAEVLHRDGEKKPQEDPSPQNVNGGTEEKAAIGVLENALAQAEDETDVAAAKVAKAEAAAELAEFDENIPLEQQEGQELSKAETELNALMQQLSGVERYAMRFVEETESAWSAEQLAAAEAEIEQQKREWELGRLAALRDEDSERKRKAEAETEDMITYSGTEARNQMWVTQNGKEIMPMWCPPTPPQDDSDVYIDHALGLLYEQNVMTEAQLPPVFVKKDKKRSRIEAGLPEGRHQVKVRHREETLMHAPRSLFDRPSPTLIKMRQELRLQRHRGLMRPVQNLVKPPMPVKPLPEPEHVPDWVVQEEWTILQAIQQVQEMTLNLVVLSPGHTPNWDMVADMVNMTSRIYRSPKQCRNRYESVIIPREEGKLVFDSPKKQKKNKTIYKLPQMKAGRPLRTSQLYQQDNNSSMTQVMNSRFDAIRSVSNRRAPTVKPLLVDPAMKNPKHAEVLAECSIEYDSPLTPVEVATKRADRIAKEKQAAVANEQQLAVLRLQQQQLQNVSKPNASPIVSVSSPVTSQASTSTGRAMTTLTVQEMVSGVTNRTIVSSPSNTSAAQPRTTPNVLAVQTSSPATTPTKGTRTITAAQLQMYRNQNHGIVRQHQIKVMQSRAISPSAGAVASGAKVSVAVSGASQARVQQVKPGIARSVVTESEMVALIKRQQAAKGIATTTLTSAQILAQAGIQPQQTASSTQQVATLVKTLPAASLPGINLPQVKTPLGTGVKASTVTTQQIRQLSLQQQLLAQQRKLPQQKLAQLSQVPGKSGTPAQLIVQSPKSMPTTMTMQQIQQVMKHVQPHVVMTGASSAGTGRASVPSVTIDTSGRSTVNVSSALAGAIKASASPQQQAILTQVSAVLQQGQQGITMRQPVRIQTSGTPLVAVAVSQAATVLTLPPSDNTQQQ